MYYLKPTTMNLHSSYRESKLSNRYIHNDHIDSILNKHSDYFTLKKIGTSVDKRPIKMFTIICVTSNGARIAVEAKENE